MNPKEQLEYYIDTINSSNIMRQDKIDICRLLDHLYKHEESYKIFKSTTEILKRLK